MIYRIRIGRIPEGNLPMVGQSVTARRIDTGEALGSAVTDSAGFVTFTSDGHWVPFYLQLTNVPGGDKFWRSDESHAVGSFSPKEVPFVLRALGDGVITSYSGQLEVSLVSGGPSVAVAPGAANVAGYPVVFSGFTNLVLTRPSSGTRYYTVFLRVIPEGSVAFASSVGNAFVTALYAEIGFPALTQTADLWDFPLANVTVPSSGAITLTDLRSFSASSAAVTGTSSLASFSTTNVSGEYVTPMDFTLTLPNSVTYDVNVSASVTQDLGGGMVNQGTFGSFGTGTSPVQFRQPGQLAVDSSGNVYIADTGNSRVVVMNSAGTPYRFLTGLNGITGVCIDSSFNIYVVGNDPSQAIHLAGFARKYTSLGELVWIYTPTDPPTEDHFQFGYIGHCATDGTTLYATAAGSIPSQPHWLVTFPAATGDHVGLYDPSLVHPYGLTMSGSIPVTTDTSRDIVIGAGIFFPVPANARGLTFDGGSRYWVAFSGGVARQYTDAGVLVGQLTESDPMGVAAGPGNVLWVSNYNTGTVAKYALQPTGYGGIAVAINAGLGTYANLDISGTIQASTTTTVAGPTSLTIRLAGKANLNTATFRNLVLSARAVPRAV